MCDHDDGFRRRWLCAAANSMLDGIRSTVRCTDVTGETLHFTITNVAWRDQVNKLTPEIVEKVNALAGEPLISNIRCRVGKIPGNTTVSRPDEADNDIMEAPGELVKAAGRIRDKGVREAFMKLGIKWEQLKKKQ